MIEKQTVEIQEEPKQLLKLQTCHTTQHTNEGTKSDWSIEENMTNNVIHILPRKLRDKEVLEVVNFAKKYELEAFNIGIKFQKEQQNSFLLAQISELTNNIKGLAAENEKLANTLDNLTRKM